MSKYSVLIENGERLEHWKKKKSFILEREKNYI
jgi:hypothetical protein